MKYHLKVRHYEGSQKEALQHQSSTINERDCRIDIFYYHFSNFSTIFAQILLKEMSNKKIPKFIYHVAMFSIVATALLSCNQRHSEETSSTKCDSLVIVEPELRYGLPVDSFIIEENKVGRNEHLSSILLREGVSFATIHTIAEKSKESFDVRGIRRGHNYTLFFSTDTLRELKHFVYDIDATSYLRCSLSDSIAVAVERHKVTFKRCEAGATITTCLWDATQAKDLPPSLSLELSDIFAWTVDFFGIEKGDNFRVIYTERCVGDNSIGIERIDAAVFTHHGKPFYAFFYEQDSTSSYFDLEGNSLRKVFLKAPLKYSRISSRFTHSRLHPVLKIRRPHHGIDYAAPTGTHVYTIGDGRVIAKGWDKKGGGNYVKIRHNSVYTTVYMHLNNFAKGLKNGDMVKQGQLIGTVGRTGLATGPHLDFRVYMNNQPIDPLKIEAPPVEPVNNDNIQDFINYSDSIRGILDAINVE